MVTTFSTVTAPFFHLGPKFLAEVNFLTASTNDITLEFMKLAASANATADDPNGELLAPNLAVLERSAQSLLTQLASLIPSASQVGAVAPDFLILPIIPLGLSVRGNDLVRSEGIGEARFRQLVTRYNDVLIKGLTSLAESLGDRGKVCTYDIPA